MAQSDKIEAAIEQKLVDALDQDLTAEQIKLLETKVTTVRKLASE